MLFPRYFARSMEFYKYHPPESSYLVKKNEKLALNFMHEYTENVTLNPLTTDVFISVLMPAVHSGRGLEGT